MTNSNYDRSYWLREFALAIYAKSPIDDEEGCVYAAEQLLSAIERKERESARPNVFSEERIAKSREELAQGKYVSVDELGYMPDPTTRELEALRDAVNAIPNWACTPEDRRTGEAMRSAVIEAAHAYIRAIERAHPNPPSDGSVVASGSSTAAPSSAAQPEAPSPDTEDAQAGHSFTPRTLTDTDRELFAALSGFDWNGSARNDQRKRVKKGWDAIRAWLEWYRLEWYTARRDDPTLALREAYRDACVAECGTQREFLESGPAKAMVYQRLSDRRAATDAAKRALDAAQKGGAR